MVWLVIVAVPSVKKKKKKTAALEGLPFSVVLVDDSRVKTPKGPQACVSCVALAKHAKHAGRAGVSSFWNPLYYKYVGLLTHNSVQVTCGRRAVLGRNGGMLPVVRRSPKATLGAKVLGIIITYYLHIYVYKPCTE
jgi:hypothetical protein